MLLRIARKSEIRKVNVLGMLSIERLVCMVGRGLMPYKVIYPLGLYQIGRRFNYGSIDSMSKVQGKA
jgi:hypothetical protein